MPVYDVCMNQPYQGDGIESWLDVDSAVVNAIRVAWEKNDRTSSVSVRNETGVIEAIVITNAEGSALVLLADGTVVMHPRAIDASKE